MIDHIFVGPMLVNLYFISMSTVTISAKYQVVIPKSIRDKSNIAPGQKVEVINYNGRIEIIPLKNIKSLRGIAKGIHSNIERDEDRY